MATDPPNAGMVIVGAGECGVRAAFALREQGFAGPVTLIGAEPHLPYERPPLSKDLLAEGEPEGRTIAGEARFAETGIRLVRSAQAVAIDRPARTLTLADGSTLPYRRLLLATGASPRRMPLAEGIPACAYLRTHDDALAIRPRLAPGAKIAVIGGGFIGLELAAAAQRRGCAVTVIETQPRILMRGVPAEIAAVVHSRHETAGVRILCGARIAELEPRDTGVRIVLDGLPAVDADLVVVGIGAVPNTDLAETAGLRIDNGIAVDSHLRTDDSDIFAAGDCCSFPLDIYGGRRVRLESWRNAQEQGALAALNMLDRPEPHAAVPWFWSDQYDLTLQIAGLPDEGAETVRRDLDGGAFLLFHIATDGRLVAASGIGPGNAVARDIRLAEMLIARRATPPLDKLAAPDTKLKTLLAA